MKLFIYQSLTQSDYKQSRIIKQVLDKLLKVKVFYNLILLQKTINQCFILYREDLDHQYRTPFIYLNFTASYMPLLFSFKSSIISCNNCYYNWG